MANLQIYQNLYASTLQFLQHHWISYHSRPAGSHCRSPFYQESSIHSALLSIISHATWARTSSTPTSQPRPSNSTANNSIFRMGRIYSNYAWLSMQPSSWLIWLCRTQLPIVLRAVQTKVAFKVEAQARLLNRVAIYRLVRRTAPSYKLSRYQSISWQRN